MANNPNRATRWRPLRHVKPSFLVLLALVPLVVWLFLDSDSYRRSLAFILPGLRFTILTTIFGYIVASVLGLVLAGLMLLKTGDHTIRNFLIAMLLLGLLSGFLFTRGQSTYQLVGSTEGRIAIVRGTPSRLVDIVEEGRYAQEAGTREFRSVQSIEDALERLESGTVNAVFVPADRTPADAPVLYEVTFLPDEVRNPAIYLAGIAFLLLLLTFGSWQTDEHPMAIFADLYVDLIRGIPMLVVILFIGFVLPPAIRDATGGRINISSDLARGVLAIALGYAAYMAEIFRAGIEAIPRGQFEAARALGLNGWQMARFVVLPQAVTIVLPPLGNEFIAMLKDTALLSVIGIGDVTRKAREFGAATLNLFPPYNTAAIIYVALTLTASSMLSWLERRAKVGRS
jgi:polar amino acid transport system permease protein